MIINDQYEFIFVAIARTGSTSIKSALQHPDELKKLPPIYHASIHTILENNPHKKNYFKWAFVRNPWDRMVSAYHEFRNISAHGEWAEDLSLFLSAPTFEQFVLNFKGTEVSKDIHFIPQFDCISIDGKIAVDFVGRYENYQKDFDHFCSSVNMPSFTLPRSRRTSRGDYRGYYQNTECIDVVRDFYHKDIEFFDYEF